MFSVFAYGIHMFFSVAITEDFLARGSRFWEVGEDSLSSGKGLLAES